MKARVRIERGVVVGTSGGKYDNGNPIARYFVSGFDRTIAEMAAYAKPASVLEVGSGEGHVTRLLLDATDADILATDLSAHVLAKAEESIGSGRVTYRAVDVMSLAPLGPPPDLVACCEVLEHLPDPQRALELLRSQEAQWYLFSVPQEPIWRVLNVARGAYLKELGNSPGHLQHWSKKGFLKFISQAFEPVIVRAPLPWTVVLCRPHDRPT